MALIGTMDKFDPKSDEWNVYQEQLEQFFAVNDIKDSQAQTKRVSALLSLIGSETYKVLRDLCTPDLPKTKTYEELCKLLKTHFSPSTCTFRERIDFFDARQEECETINQWVARIHNLATNCEFGANLKTYLRDKFICGMKKGNIRDRLCEEKPDATLETVLKLALSREGAQMAESKNVNLVRYGKKTSDNQFQHQAKFQARKVRGDPENRGKWRCKSCGNQHTGNQRCKYKDYRCKLCKTVGHLAKVCTNNMRQNLVEFEDGNSMDSVETDIYNINFKDSDPIYANVTINKHKLSMQVDSGAAVSVITEKYYQKLSTKYSLQESRLVLRDYSGNLVPTLGIIKAEVEYNGVRAEGFALHVVKEGKPNLLGRDFLRTFKFKLVSDILKLDNDKLINIADKFRNLFDNKLGCYKSKTFSILVEKDTTPIFLKPRPVPFMFKEKIEKELQRLQEEGVISPIETSEWGTPLVPVQKGDGGIRLCGDYMVTVNKAVVDVKYPLPRIEEIFAKLNGGITFSKIDLSNAYNQLSLDDESAKLLTWSTHKGLFRVNRLPFGIRPASALFQKTLEQTLQGLESVINFVDDIIVTGKTPEEHEQNLMATFKRLEEAGFKIRLDKCQFFQDEINYLGHTISKEGLRKNSDKVDAILKAPRPTNQTQIKSFAGLVNYYGKFVPRLATLMKPMYDLLKKNQEFSWNKECEKSFQAIKEIVASEEVLTHFNPELELILSTDASQEGIAAALSHRMPNGDVRPILFLSRTLSSAEKNYAVIDKEGLAVYWAVKKLHQYLMGQKFTIETDHRPLIALFGERSAIPAMTSYRIHRWALYLAGFAYKITYVPEAKNKVADMLSRHPIEIPNAEADDNEPEELNLLISEGLPVSSNKICAETRRDPVLSRILHFVKTGWPKEVNNEKLIPYTKKKDEITCEQDCLMWGYRVIVPMKLRDQILDELHASHLGIVKMKSIARSHFWWPKLDVDIENIGKSCNACARTSAEPQKAIKIPWYRPTGPNERVHIDFLGPIDKTMYLIMQDAFSKWPEVYEMKNITSTLTIQQIRNYCSSWGIMNTLVSDNGRQLVSDEFETFLKKNGIRHITSEPYHPATNGLAENSVKSFKKGLQAALIDPRNRNTPRNVLVNRYLLYYRTSKHCSTNETPSFLMIGRNLRTVFDQMRPNTSETIKTNHNVRNKNVGRSYVPFQKGDGVWARDYRKTNKKEWTEAKIVEVISDRSYKCETQEGDIWRRHIDQLKKREKRRVNSTEQREPINEAKYETEHSKDRRKVPSNSSSESETEKTTARIKTTIIPSQTNEQGASNSKTGGDIVQNTTSRHVGTAPRSETNTRPKTTQPFTNTSVLKANKQVAESRVPDKDRPKRTVRPSIKLNDYVTFIDISPQ